MKKLILLSIATLWIQFSEAQEKKQFEVKNFDGMISILAPARDISIIGHDGKNVIIEAEQIGDLKIPEKAKGLKMVTPGGLDNTGMAATVKESSMSLVTKLDSEGKPVSEEVNVLEIILSNTAKLFKSYVVKVPKNVNVKFKEDNFNWVTNSDGILTFKGLSAELEVNCNACNIDVKEFSGNLIANTSFGSNIKVDFSELSQERVTSISANQGDIEVLLPSNSKANLRINSGEGNIYTDFDLEKANTEKSIFTTNGVARVDGWGSASNEVDVQNKLAQNQKELQTRATSSAKTVTGFRSSQAQSKYRFSTTLADRLNIERYDYTINGGGIYMNINSSFGGNIYLKKK